MAALMLPASSISSTAPVPPVPPVPKSKSSKQGRSRPNLSRVCQKTKICSFHVRGACTRGEACTFAHEEQELQPKPDLSCTKPCPEMLSSGHCSRPDCKYAHNDNEIRQLGMDGPDVLGRECEEFPLQPTTSSISRNQISCVSSLAGSCFSTHPVRQNPETAPQVVSRLNDAALSGTLTMGDMISHLTRIFLALYESRPDIANRLKMPAHDLASATVRKAWEDAGLDTASLLSFQDFVRWCALPADVLLPEVPRQEAEQPRPSLKSSRVMRADSDMWSQCSTDEGSSDLSVTHAGWQTPESFEDLEEEGWREPELKVMNTFIHFSPRRFPNRARRAQSVPSRLH